MLPTTVEINIKNSTINSHRLSVDFSTETVGQKGVAQCI